MNLIEALKQVFFSGGKLGIQLNLAETKNEDKQPFATVLQIQALKKIVMWNYDDEDDIWRPTSFDLNEGAFSVDMLLSHDYIVVDFEKTVPEDKRTFEIKFVEYDDDEENYYD